MHLFQTDVTFIFFTPSWKHNEISVNQRQINISFVISNWFMLVIKETLLEPLNRLKLIFPIKIVTGNAV